MRTLFFLSILLVNFSCSPKELPTSIVLNDNVIEVKFSYMTTKDEMIEVKSQLKDQYNIEMQFEGSRFFENGKLRDLNLKVTLPNGTGGTTSSMYAILETKYVGFRIRQNEEDTPLQIGTLSS